MIPPGSTTSRARQPCHLVLELGAQDHVGTFHREEPTFLHLICSRCFPALQRDNRGLRGRLTLPRMLKCGARKPIPQCRAQHARNPCPASFRPAPVASSGNELFLGRPRRMLNWGLYSKNSRAEQTGP